MDRAAETPTYHVVGFRKSVGRDKFPPAIIEERVGGITINRYTAYDHGTYFTLYPMSGGKLVASNIPYTRKNIDIKKTRRDF
jgi:hypothetical protein